MLVSFELAKWLRYVGFMWVGCVMLVSYELAFKATLFFFCEFAKLSWLSLSCLCLFPVSLLSYVGFLWVG